jgi:methylthioribose-1-phosphate isomerase
VRQLPETAAVANPAFDITPAQLVDRIISERGCCAADRLRTLHPEEADG